MAEKPKIDENDKILSVVIGTIAEKSGNDRAWVAARIGAVMRQKKCNAADAAAYVLNKVIDSQKKAELAKVAPEPTKLDIKPAPTQKVEKTEVDAAQLAEELEAMLDDEKAPVSDSVKRDLAVRYDHLPSDISRSPSSTNLRSTTSLLNPLDRETKEPEPAAESEIVYNAADHPQDFADTSHFIMEKKLTDKALMDTQGAEKSGAKIVKVDEVKIVEYESIEDFEKNVITGVLISVATIVTAGWVVEFDRSGKRKARSQPSIYGEKTSKSGGTYIPIQHIVPIIVEDPHTGERDEKWLDTNIGFRKTWKEHLSLGTLPKRFYLKTSGTGDDYKVAFVAAR